jgi:hypothetical protein
MSQQAHPEGDGPMRTAGILTCCPAWKSAWFIKNPSERMFNCAETPRPVMCDTSHGNLPEPGRRPPGGIRSELPREHGSAHPASPFQLQLPMHLSRVLSAGLALVVATLLLTPLPALANTWDFRVFLDDKEIGTHRFDLLDQGGERQLTSQARMNVKILFVTAYTYDHHDVEHWSGNCVSKLSSRTDDNGKKHHVEVQRREQDTTVQTQQGTQRLGDCVMTFAYWNPAMLQQTRLLNSQDGEYIDVKITDAGADSIAVRGVKTAARRFELRSKKLSIDLWYSPQDEWLALESMTERGQKLIYQLK